MKILKFFGHLFTIVFLTITTQIGGVIWLLTLIISRKTKWKKRYVFPLLYLVLNLIIIPKIAAKFGRVPLPILSENVSSINWFYPLMFRNYVTPELKNLLVEASKSSHIKITYLDANFPFFDGFPLLPHLSHSDGKKVDLSFMYLDADGKNTNEKPSSSGYGAYIKSTNNTSKSCTNKGYWQYDFPKHLTFGTDESLKFDKTRTAELIKALLSNPKTEKIFLEPYLKEFLGLGSENKIRFHGCKAVRHDDHIHFQIR